MLLYDEENLGRCVNVVGNCMAQLGGFDRYFRSGVR